MKPVQCKAKLLNGAYDRQLCRIYSCQAGELEGRRQRAASMLDALEAFEPDCSGTALFSAPGRTEIGGNHTDHQRGCVLAAAVTMDALAAAAPNGTDRVRIQSEGYPPFEVDISSTGFREEEITSPAGLVRGIAAALCAGGYRPRGFSACITSDVPKGSGLSSSAAFEVLIGSIFNSLFCGGGLSAIDIARAGQFAENNYAMKPCGLMDQAASAAGGLVSMDFSRRENPVLDSISFDFDSRGFTLCVVNTGGDHCNLTPDYAAIPREMRAVARQLGKKVLADADEEQFYAELPRLRERLGDRAVLRAIHCFDESRRALRQADCLRGGDLEGFLTLVNESGRSSEQLLQNIWSPRRSRSQAVAVGLELSRRMLNGRGAYRVHGGGFAGTIQAYVPHDLWPQFARRMEQVFGSGSVCRLSIRPEGGEQVLPDCEE